MPVRLFVSFTVVAFVFIAACGSKSKKDLDAGSAAVVPEAGVMVPAPYSIDDDVAAAMKRLNDQYAPQVKAADEAHERAIQTIAEAPGATEVDKQKVKEALEQMKHGGHSPRGQAIINGVAAANNKLKHAGDAAKQLPADQQKAAVDAAAAQAESDAKQNTENNVKKAEEYIVTSLVKQAAPAAAFAACVALGGGAACGAVATLVGKLLGTRSTVKTTQLTKLVQGAVKALSDDCPPECWLDIAASVELPKPEDVGTFIEGLMTASNNDAVKQVAAQARKVARHAEIARKCLGEVIVSTEPHEIGQRLNTHCGEVVKELGMPYAAEDIECVLQATKGPRPLEQAVVCIIDRRFGDEAR